MAAIFIDYVTLMLINMVAGLFLLGAFVLKGIDSEGRADWAPGFGAVGLVALLFGLHMSWTWPLPGSYNIAFGELSVLFGAVHLGIALGLARDWRLHGIGVYAAFGGFTSLIVGTRILQLWLTAPKEDWLTASPALAGIAFVLSGLAGVLFFPVTIWSRKPNLCRAAAIVLFLAGLLWGMTATFAYWGHLTGFAKYTPEVMQQVQGN